MSFHARKPAKPIKAVRARRADNPHRKDTPRSQSALSKATSATNLRSAQILRVGLARGEQHRVPSSLGGRNQRNLGGR